MFCTGRSRRLHNEERNQSKFSTTIRRVAQRKTYLTGSKQCRRTIVADSNIPGCSNTCWHDHGCSNTYWHDHPTGTKGHTVPNLLAKDSTQPFRQRLHEHGFICNRIVFDAVAPPVCTTPIETVAETVSI